jgi:hypothetical protein
LIFNPLQCKHVNERGGVLKELLHSWRLNKTLSHSTKTPRIYSLQAEVSLKLNHPGAIVIMPARYAIYRYTSFYLPHTIRGGKRYGEGDILINYQI